MIPERDVLDVVRLLRPDSFLRRYIAHFGAVSDAPYAWHLGTGLGVLSALAPIDLTADFIGTVRANFWVMLVGDSYETRKTYSIGVGEGLVYEKARKCLGGAVAGSPEGLYDLLMNKPKALITYPEFGAFLSRSSAGKHLADLRTALTEAFDGRLNGRVLAPDKNGKRKSMPNLDDVRLSIVAGTAHGFLEQNTDYVDWSSGFLNRWCIFEAQRERSYPITEPRSDTAVRKAAALLAETETRIERDVGRFAGLTPEAKDRWIHWMQAREAERRDVADAELNAATARTPVTAAKVALLIAYDYGIPCTGSATWRLPVEVLEVARRIADLHERSVRSILKNISRNDAEREQRAVLKVIEAGPATKAQILQRMTPKQPLRVLNGVIDTLIEARTIFAHPTPTGATVYATTAPDTSEADAMEIDDGESNIIHLPR